MQLSLEIAVGTTFSALVFLANRAQEPIDLTSASLLAYVKRTYTDAAPTIILSCSNVWMGNPPTSGTYTLSLTPDDSINAGLSGSYVYDVLRTDINGIVWRDVSGSVLASQTVTL